MDSALEECTDLKYSHRNKRRPNFSDLKGILKLLFIVSTYSTNFQSDSHVGGLQTEVCSQCSGLLFRVFVLWHWHLHEEALSCRQKYFEWAYKIPEFSNNPIGRNHISQVRRLRRPRTRSSVPHIFFWKVLLQTLSGRSCVMLVSLSSWESLLNSGWQDPETENTVASFRSCI